MSLNAAMILGFAAIVSRWYLVLAAGKAWGGISKAHPEFAAALYASGLDMAFYGISPLNWRPLFRSPVPVDIEVTITRLRRVVVASGVLGIVALIYVPATFLYTIRAG